jgi:hypothetical protein
VRALGPVQHDDRVSRPDRLGHPSIIEEEGQIESEFDIDLGLFDEIEWYFVNRDPIGRSQKMYSRMFELLRRKAQTACQKKADDPMT